jgi:signal transduction histidine kinase
MRLDPQTTIFMICFIYLILHGVIWLALQEYRSYQVKLWCFSGMCSGIAVILLATRGSIPEFVFLYVSQLFMLVGNGGRMMALRMYLLPEPQDRKFQFYYFVNAAYFVVFSYLIYFHQAEWEALILFNGFYALLCFDYFRIGLQLNKHQKSLGAGLLMGAGLTLTITLAVRSLGVYSAGTIDDIYAPSWHQAVMVIGQFVAITLSNIAFLRIFLENAERQKLAVASELASTHELADAMQRNSMELQKLLQEREEIIRQLTMLNKTAGMGALVASLAHELNQPLTVIQMNAEMIDLLIANNAMDSNQTSSIHKAMTGLKKANQRAATIISTLRNMFGPGGKSISVFDINDLVKDILLLSQSTLQRHSIDLTEDLHPHALTFTGDKSQLQQVLLNLVTNACESFKADLKNPKEITVTTRTENGNIVFTIRDNGCGIDPSIENSIFELLRTSKEDGMGIGLWLSKTIIESHNGTINFTSNSEMGTTFKVSLPATKEVMCF